MQILCYSIYIIYYYFFFLGFFLGFFGFFLGFFFFFFLEQLRSNLNKICYSMRYSC